MDETTLEVLSLSSYSGIVIATMFIVEVLKRILDKVAGFKSIPIFVYACTVAGVLAILANKVIKIDGHPLLQGQNVWIAVWKSVIGAAGASGFYGWLRNPEAPKTASDMGVDVKSKILSLLIPVGMLAMVGCTACPEKIALREAIAPTVSVAMDENVSLVSKIAGGQQLPKFTADDVRIRQNNKDAVNKLINDDRARDAGGAK